MRVSQVSAIDFGLIWPLCLRAGGPRERARRDRGLAAEDFIHRRRCMRAGWPAAASTRTLRPTAFLRRILSRPARHEGQGATPPAAASKSRAAPQPLGRLHLAGGGDGLRRLQPPPRAAVALHPQTHPPSQPPQSKRDLRHSSSAGY